MNANLDTTFLLRPALHLSLLARAWWLRLHLPRKLATAASAALLCGAVFVGNIAARHVRSAIVYDTAASTALYMDSFIAPHVQELANAATLSQASRQALASLLAPTVIGKPIVGFRIWTRQHIVFGNDPNAVGRQFAPSAGRDLAWAGRVYADPDLDSLDDDDDAEMKALGVPILEVYAPVHHSGTGRIIALVETYQLAGDLRLQIWTAQGIIWIALGLGVAAISALLFTVARSRAHEISHLYWENQQHQTRMSGANRRVLEMSELHMRQVGTDLYDGPMQLVGLALLRLDTLRDQITQSTATQQPYASEIERIRSALNGALDDIRILCSRFLPSKIKSLSLTDTIMLAARKHEQRVGRPVAWRIQWLPDQPAFSIKASVYRFVQDALSAYGSEGNAYAVCAQSKNNVIEVRVLSSLTALRNGDDLGRDTALGSLRDRVEALGGEFSVQSALGFHSITARFAVWEADAHNG